MAELTDKQKRFCEEYVIDWNATRAAIAAGYSEQTADKKSWAWVGKSREVSEYPEMYDYVQEIRQNLEKAAGLSALRNLLELKKIAFANMADLRESWAEAKEFQDLTPDQKAAIAEIWTETTNIGDGDEWMLRKTKIKLHDKLKAIEMINRMLGYNAPDKIDHTSQGEKVFTGFNFLPTDDGKPGND